MRYSWFSAANPVLVLRVLNPLESGRPEDEALAEELWKWVLGNIYLPKECVREYEKARAEKKAQAKAKVKKTNGDS